MPGMPDPNNRDVTATGPTACKTSRDMVRKRRSALLATTILKEGSGRMTKEGQIGAHDVNFVTLTMEDLTITDRVSSAT